MRPGRESPAACRRPEHTRSRQHTRSPATRPVPVPGARRRGRRHRVLERNLERVTRGEFAGPAGQAQHGRLAYVEMRVGERLGQRRHRDLGRRARQRARRAFPHLPRRCPQRRFDGGEIVGAASYFAQRGQRGRAHQRVGVGDQRADGPGSDVHERLAGLGVDGQRVERTDLDAQGAAIDTQRLVDRHRHIGPSVVDQRHVSLLIRLPRMVMRSPRIRMYSKSTGWRRRDW